MYTTRIVYTLTLLFCYSICFAQGNFKLIPASMKYFPEERKSSLRFAASTYLSSLAAQRNLDFFAKPKDLLVDAVMTDEELNKAVLISANRHVNPEFMNTVFQHPEGYFFQVQINGQQLALFFYNFPAKEAQDTLNQIKRDYLISREFYFIIETAEAGQDSETAFANSAPSPSPTTIHKGTKTGKALGMANEYILGDEWVGCGKGVLEGMNSIARYPWDAVVEAGQGARSLFNDPKEFWDRSVEQFKGIAKIAQNFREHLGDAWESFQHKSVKEKSEIWCNYVGTPGLLGAAGKAAKGAGFISKGTTALSVPKVPPVTPVTTRASSTLAEIDKSIARNFYAVERGTPAESMAENYKVLKALSEAELPSTNPKRLAGINQNQINELYLKIKENPVADLCNYSKYDPRNTGIGFCFGRATAAHIEALNAGLEKDKIRKVWAVGSLKAGKTEWGYHVSTIVKGSDGKWWAIDPIMGSPIPVEEWYTKMKAMDTSGNMRLFTSEAKRFGPASKAKYSPDRLGEEQFNNYFTDLMNNFKQESKEVIQRANQKRP